MSGIMDKLSFKDSKFGEAIGGAEGGGATDLSGAIGMGLGDVGKVVDIAKDSFTPTRQRMDEKGNVTHEVNALGKIAELGAAGAKYGGIGALVGGGIGAGFAVVDALKQPDVDDMVAKRHSFDLGNSMKGIEAESTVAKTGLMAKDGMDVQGGSKEIEVERDEVVYRKSGRGYKKVADFRGGKPHEQGGEDYEADEGDVIVPAKKRMKAEQLVRTRNWKGFESMRMALPKDTAVAKKGGMYGDGTSGVKTKSKGAGSYAWATEALRAINEIYPNATSKTKQSLLANIAHETNGGKYFSEGAMTWKNMESRNDLRTIKGKVNAYMKKNNLTKDQYDKLPEADRISIQYQGETGHALAGGVGALQTTDVSGNKIEAMRKVGKDLGSSTDDEIRAFVNENVYNSTIYSLSVMKERGITEEQLNKTDGALDMRKKFINPGETSKKHLDSVVARETKVIENFPKTEIDAMSGGEAKAAAMHKANDEAEGGLTYGSYAAKQRALGKEVLSEEWFKENVTNPRRQGQQDAQAALDENESGYWTATSPTGQANAAQLAEEMKEVAAKNPKNIGPKKGEKKGPLDYLAEAAASMTGGGVAGMSPGGMMGHGEVGKAMYEGFGVGRLVGDKGKSVVGFHDTPQGRKVQEEANAFYNYLQHDADVTWMPADAVRKIDEWRARIAGSNDPVGYKIASVIDGMDIEQIEKLTKDAKTKGIISDAGVSYVNNVATEPEAHKQLQHSLITQADIASMADPRAWIGMWGIAKAGTKGLVNAAGLTAKGWKAVGVSKQFKMMKKLAKSDPKVKARLARMLNARAKNTNSVNGAEANDELIKLGDELNKDLGKGWNAAEDIGWNEVIKAAKDLKAMVMKVPDKVKASMFNKSFTEIKQMKANLVKATGKSWDTIKTWSKDDLAKHYANTMGVAKKEYEAMTASRDAAAATHKTAKESADAAKLAYQQALKGSKATPEQLADMEATVEKAGRVLSGAEAKLLKEFQNSDAITKNFNILAKDDAMADIYKEMGIVIDESDFLIQGEKSLDKTSKLARRKENAARELEMLDEFLLNKGEGDSAKIRQLFGRREVLQNVIKANKDAIAKGEPYDFAANMQKQLLNTTTKIKAEQDAADALKVGDAALAGKAKSLAEIEKQLAGAPKTLAALRKDHKTMKSILDGTKTIRDGINIINNRDFEGVGVPEEQEEIKKIFTPEEIEEAKVVPGDPEKRPEVVDPLKGEVTGLKELEGKDPEATIVEAGEKEPPKVNKGIGIKDGLDTLAAYAPAIYNIVKGLGSPDKAKREFVAPQTLTYNDKSEPMRNLVDAAFETAIGNARNLSGGLASNFRSNTEKAWAERIRNRSQIDAGEAERADQVANANIGILNQADQINTQARDRGNIMDAQNKAATNSFLGQGFADIANIGAMRTKDKNLARAEQIALNSMGSKNYDQNGNYIGGTTTSTPASAEETGATGGGGTTKPFDPATFEITAASMGRDARTAAWEQEQAAIMRKKAEEEAIVKSIGGTVSGPMSAFNFINNK